MRNQKGRGQECPAYPLTLAKGVMCLADQLGEMVMQIEQMWVWGIHPTKGLNRMNDLATLNLKRLLALRGFAIAFVLLALTLSVGLLHMDFPLMPMLWVVGLHVAASILTWIWLQRVEHIFAPEFVLQLMLDTVVLAVLLYYSGGYTNPFVSLFLLPLVIAASVLPKVYAWFMAALTISCYTALIFYFIPLPQPDAHSLYYGRVFDLHVLGMWFSFLLSTGLMVFFVVHMANDLRERDQALAQAREKALRDEHLVELATLSTGAAHELSTPLATMAVLANELKYDHADDQSVMEKVDIFRAQLDRCKAILSDISTNTEYTLGQGEVCIAIDEYLHQVVRQWRSIRPQAEVVVDMQGGHPAPHIVADKTLSQTIINILNNAADASQNHVEVDARWGVKQLTLDVCDQGQGVDVATQNAIGTPFFTTKSEGHGLGLYLARFVLDRYNGSLELSNRPAGGTRARLVLPLKPREA